MPKGIFVRTVQHRENISRALKGRHYVERQWANLPSETKAKRRLGLIKSYDPAKHFISEDQRKKMTKGVREYYRRHSHVYKGKTLPIAWRMNIKNNCVRGESSHLWKGGVCSLPAYRAFTQKRRQIKKRNNGGTHSIMEWIALKKRNAYLCNLCGRREPEIKLTEDHVVPISRGGRDDIANIQPLCMSCNMRKGAKEALALEDELGQMVGV